MNDQQKIIAIQKIIVEKSDLDDFFMQVKDIVEDVTTFDTKNSCVYADERHDVYRCRVHGGFVDSDTFKKESTELVPCTMILV